MCAVFRGCACKLALINDLMTYVKSFDLKDDACSKCRIMRVQSWALHSHAHAASRSHAQTQGQTDSLTQAHTLYLPAWHAEQDAPEPLNPALQEQEEAPAGESE